MRLLVTFLIGILGARAIYWLIGSDWTDTKMLAAYIVAAMWALYGEIRAINKGDR